MNHPARDPRFRDRLVAGLEAAVAQDGGYSAVEAAGERDAVVVRADDGTRLAVSVCDASEDPGSAVPAVDGGGNGAGTTLAAACNVNDLFLCGPACGPRHLDIRERPAETAAGDLLAAARPDGARTGDSRETGRNQVAGRVRSFQAATWPAFSAALDGALADGRLAAAFERWAREHGHEDRRRADQRDRAAKEYALLVGSSVLLTGDAAVTLFDGGPGERGLFDRFPETARTRRALRRLAASRGRLPLVDGAPVGGVYEDIVGDGERATHGQFYTPPAVAEAVARWALDGSLTDGAPRVLDPAAGGGAVTVAAYDALADQYTSLAHEALADRLVAVDRERTPLRLTAIRVAGRGDSRSRVAPRTHHASFFDLDPADVGPVDAVVGNPPYVRHEALQPGAEHFREHLRSFERPEGGTYDDLLSEQSDAYVYFVTHAARFLREGGRLGYVLPSKWLATDYGRGFQRFLAEQFRLAAVVGFDARPFEDALVDPCLLLAERCSDPVERARSVTRFVRLAGEPSARTVLDAVAADDAPAGAAQVETRPDHRTVAVGQPTVADARSGKLAHLLSAPEAAIRLVEHPGLARLDDLATVAYGNKTGANRFFFLDEEDRAEWGIDDRFLAPAVKSPAEVDGRIVDAAATDRYLLDVRDYVRQLDGDVGAAAVERALRRDGYDALAAYLEHGEREGYHERTTCAARTPWFDLGDLARPEVLHPKFFDEQVTAMWNRGRVAPSNAVDCLTLAPDVDEVAALGVLDSTVHKVLLECWGRAEGGGALQLMTYELASLPVVDPRDLGDERHRRLRAAARRLLDGDESAREAVDRTLLTALDADLTVPDLRTARETLVERRVENGKRTAVPVERA